MTIASIREALKRLGAKFGPAAAMNPPLTTSDLASAEAYFGVALPDAYRRVVLDVGNGGARYFFPLERTDDGRWQWNDVGESEKGLEKTLGRPFLHAAKASVYDHPFFLSEEWEERQEAAIEEGVEAEDELSEWLDENLLTLIDHRWLDQHFQGSAAIMHYGCAIRDRLVVSGPLAGNVWHSPEGMDFVLEPIQRAGHPLDFDEWFLDLLEASSVAAR